MLAITAAQPNPPQAGADTTIADETPLDDRPRVLDGRILGIDSTASVVVVAGSFQSIREAPTSAPTITQPNIFAFHPSTGVISASFRPAVNGAINEAVISSDGKSVYIGGAFSSVNGQPRTNLAKLDIATGQVDPAFKPYTNNAVEDIAVVDNEVIAAGQFRFVTNNVVRDRIASFDSKTGAVLETLKLSVTDAREFAPYVSAIDVSPNGRWLLMTGNFLKVDGRPRAQIAIAERTPTGTVLSDWATIRFDHNCDPRSETKTWIRDAAFSPDSDYFTVATTGSLYKGIPYLCDATTRWELQPENIAPFQQPTWANYTGGDTTWAVEPTREAVYVGGHQRWQNDPFANDSTGKFAEGDGPGSVEREGIAALDPLSGVPLSWDPTRDRGRGVEAIHVTDDYLYVGSDTIWFNRMLRERLAVLPFLPGYGINPDPEAVRFPVDFTIANDNGTANRISFNGTSLGAPSATNLAYDATAFKDGFEEGDAVTAFGNDGAYYKISGANTVNLSTTVGYVDDLALTPFDQPYNVDATVGAAFSNGTMFYTRSNDNRLWSRGYSLESGIIEAQEAIRSWDNWSNTRTLAVVGDWLFATTTTGQLTRTYIDHGYVDSTTRVVIDSGAAGINWANVRSLTVTSGAGAAAAPATPVPLTCSGSTPWRAEYQIGSYMVAAPAVEQGTPNAAIAGRRCEAAVDYNFGRGAPDIYAGFPSNEFSAIWTRDVDLADWSKITVNAIADDGIRVYVDDVRVINEFDSALSQLNVASATSQRLAPGRHTVRVVYFEIGSDAQVHVSLATARTYPPCPTAATPFTDISSSFARADINCLYGLGITRGATATTFSPGAAVTRGEMAAFLGRTYAAVNLSPAPVVATPFTDISTSFAQQSIAQVYGLDITKGTTATTYSPNANVTREQMAAFLARLWRLLGGECPVVTQPFSDISRSFARDDIACISAVGITSGVTPTTFQPGGLVTREQMAAFLARLYRAI